MSAHSVSPCKDGEVCVHIHVGMTRDGRCGMKAEVLVTEGLSVVGPANPEQAELGT